MHFILGFFTFLLMMNEVKTILELFVNCLSNRFGAKNCGKHLHINNVQYILKISYLFYFYIIRVDVSNHPCQPEFSILSCSENDAKANNSDEFFRPCQYFKSATENDVRFPVGSISFPAKARLKAKCRKSIYLPIEWGFR